jgi:hypothetical protein
MCWPKLPPEGVPDLGSEVKCIKESQFWKCLSLHFLRFWGSIMPITKFLFIHHIIRLLQAYLTLGKNFGCFWLKLDKLRSYKTFHGAWRYELVYIVKHCKLPCELCCELDDIVIATIFVANSYFDGFKRINGHQMDG